MEVQREEKERGEDRSTCMFKWVWSRCYTTTLSNFTSVDQLLLILGMSGKVFCSSSPIFTDPLSSLAQFTTQCSSSRHREMNCWGSLQLFCAATISLFSKLWAPSSISLHPANFLPVFLSVRGFSPSSKKVRVMMSPTCEWLWFVQEQHSYRFSRRSGLLCCPSSSPLISFTPCQTLKNCLLFQEKGSEQEMYSSPALRLLFYTRLLFNLLPQWLTDSLTTGRLLVVRLSSQ